MNYPPSFQLPIIESHFPETIQVQSQQELKRNIIYNAKGKTHKDDTYLKFIGPMDKTISELYTKHDGPNWKVNKLQEMKENGLIYVYYTATNEQAQEEIIAFISFILTQDEQDLTIYLYEIHISPNYQHQHNPSLKLGTLLITKFHDLVPLYQRLSHTESQPGDTFSLGFLKYLNSTKLTVFSDNTIALNWYEKLNYVKAVESPVDKILRNGKILKPDYYIMIRYLQ